MRNRLNDETSPYLLQHAANPVHWQPWDDAALAEARSADKPILLSVGYSACHWCHVMAHESFEDPDTAKLMNELYVNVKVDREERPDLDKIYQTAHQLYTGQAGGWPLTVFLTPDGHVPIFTGTYFPNERRYGMPAFREVLEAIDKYYRTQRAEIGERGAGLARAFEEIATGAADEFAPLTRSPLDEAVARLARSFDREHGGFGGAPKFPHSTGLELLLEEAQRLGPRRPRAAGAGEGLDGEQVLQMVTHTLDRMAFGGLYDQLGGGFFRYSVDREWSIPHFEKMLYDNAALLALYADVFAATTAPLYARIASETADWVIRDMQSPDGGFYGTLDADSEHEEGKFYVWTPAELDSLLLRDESRLAQRVLGLANADGTPTAPNFEHQFWHLHVAAPPDRAAAELGLDTSGAFPLFQSARAKLLAARAQRVWPGRDDKILVSWNGLMIRGLARGARHLGRPELAAAATRAVDFIRAELWSEGRLKATYRDGRARFAAYLDDYALLADGLLELLQCRWRGADLDFACELV
ncbi:MAG TPA: thioredoxin domain-containing protein, partial [Gammaproteobacteria bacterium]|nr:thioredoxin domain-containing protein [Gammaproteobacteria bacterium]